MGETTRGPRRPARRGEGGTLRPIINECFLNECATRMYHVASSVVDVLRVATDGGARELLRVVLGEAPVPAFTIINIKAVRTNRCAVVPALYTLQFIPP